MASGTEPPTAESAVGKLSAGDASNSAGSSPAIRCPNCRTGLLRPTEDGTLKCYNCSREFQLEEDVPEAPEEGNRDLTDWEKNQLIDALTEQWLRAKGNIRRTKLEGSKQIAIEKAEGLKNLIERVKNEW